MANVELQGAFKINAVNADKAGAMQTAVTEYKNGVDTILDKIVNLDQSEYMKAMKGNTQIETIRTYISECVDAMKEVTIFIDQFSDAIDDVMDNYSSQESDIIAKETKVDELQDVDYTGVDGFSS